MRRQEREAVGWELLTDIWGEHHFISRSAEILKRVCADARLTRRYGERVKNQGGTVHFCTLGVYLPRVFIFL